MSKLKKMSMVCFLIIVLFVNLFTIGADAGTKEFIHDTYTEAYNENFNGIANGTTPEGWTVSNANDSAVVQDGALILDGRNNNISTVFLPDFLDGTKDFTFEAALTFLEINHATPGGRYMGLVFRAPQNGNPYFQADARHNVTNETAVEIVKRTANNTWDYKHQSAHSKKEIGTPYNFKVVVSGTSAVYYIDDELVGKTEDGIDIATGGFGICTSSAKIKCDNLSVSYRKTTAYVYEEDFSEVTSGTIPEGWTILGDNITAAVDETKSLIIDGKNNGTTAVFLPSSLDGTTDFTFEADLTFLEIINSTRYMGLIFRSAGLQIPYYQATARQDNTQSGAIEICKRISTGWESPYPYKSTQTVIGPLEYGATASSYRFKVVAAGSSASFYIDNKLVGKTETGINITSGGFGICTSSAKIKCDNIRIEYAKVSGYKYTEDFKGMNDGTVPEGWTTSGNDVTATVRNEALVLDGSKEGTATVFFPADLNGTTDFTFEADLKFDSIDGDNSRYMGLIYRAAGRTNRGDYYQSIARKNAGTHSSNSGIEVGKRSNNAWSIPWKTNYLQDLEIGRTYKFKIIVSGTIVTHYIDGNLAATYMGIDIPSGGFGLCTSSATVICDNIKITGSYKESSVSANPFATDIYEPATGIVVPPTVVADMPGSIEGLEALTAAEKRPATILTKVDSLANVYAPDNFKNKINGCTMDEFFHALNMKILPAFYVEDVAAATVLGTKLTQLIKQDSFICSSNENAIKAARTIFPIARGVYDATEFIGDNLIDIVHATNRSMSKIAIIASRMATKENIEYLQKRYITVWVKSDEAASAVFGGANGVITSDYMDTINFLEGITAPTISRKPFVVAHRGVKGYFENTLESAVAAYNVGCDMLEFDVFMTTDNEIVIMHDDTVDRTTSGTGKIEEMTLSEVKALTITNSGGLRVPTLKQYYEEFKGKDIILFMEIKSKNTDIIQLIKTLTEEYEMEDQIVFHTFHIPQIIKVREIYPQISIGNFIQTGPATTDNVIKLQSIFSILSPLNASYNPSITKADTSFDVDFVKAANHRGLMISAWTANDQAVFENYYGTGCHAILTDYANWASDYVTDIKAITYKTEILLKESADLSGSLITQKGEVATGAPTLVKLGGDVTLTEGVPNRTGKAIYVYKYTKPFSGGSYDIYSQPIGITVLDFLFKQEITKNDNPFSDGEIILNMKLTNLSNRTKTPFVIVSVYNNYNTITNLEIKELETAIGEYGTADIPVTLTVTADSQRILVTAFDKDVVTPLVKANNIFKP